MCATAGTSYSQKVRSNDPDNIRVTIGGNDVAFTIADEGNGQYTVSIDGLEVVFPGPIVITGLVGNDVSTIVYA